MLTTLKDTELQTNMKKPECKRKQLSSGYYSYSESDDNIDKERKMKNNVNAPSSQCIKSMKFCLFRVAQKILKEQWWSMGT